MRPGYAAAGGEVEGVGLGAGQINQSEIKGRAVWTARQVAKERGRVGQVAAFVGRRCLALRGLVIPPRCFKGCLIERAIASLQPLHVLFVNVRRAELVGRNRLPVFGNGIIRLANQRTASHDAWMIMANRLDLRAETPPSWLREQFVALGSHDAVS